MTDSQDEVERLRAQLAAREAQCRRYFEELQERDSDIRVYRRHLHRQIKANDQLAVENERLRMRLAAMEQPEENP